jgi:hypothetical protein
MYRRPSRREEFANRRNRINVEPHLHEAHGSVVDIIRKVGRAV